MGVSHLEAQMFLIDGLLELGATVHKDIGLDFPVKNWIWISLEHWNANRSVPSDILYVVFG